MIGPRYLSLHRLVESVPCADPERGKGVHQALLLVHPRKTSPNMTENFCLVVNNKFKQTNKQTNRGYGHPLPRWKIVSVISFPRTQISNYTHAAPGIKLDTVWSVWMQQKRKRNRFALLFSFGRPNPQINKKKCMYNLAQTDFLILFDMQNDYFQKKTFWQNIGASTKLLLACCCIHVILFNFNICSMTISEKKNCFGLLTPLRSQGCVSGQNFCLYVVKYFIPFDLICNMAIFGEKILTGSEAKVTVTQK